MKKILGFTLVLTFLLALSSCYSHRHPHRNLPPGKAKKIYGDKSAKRHAPGQKKKRHKNNKRGKGHYKHDVYLHFGDR
ncbi:hypothetical protein [Sphingobacterium gobiense]|uniref:Quinol oxidase subunit 4 n=1 Tax=Sphingobacterium gobiense TaxID=1382456 RepID=A0A2S9JNJ4_9SPHI|nr:hypothetical protein [Sphingobacterium gobiense]PRD54723.1 hypothetical protein C5749_14920 [Sphingobacterium gobiense]